ncbi:adenosine deaminase [Longispora urticae]
MTTPKIELHVHLEGTVRAQTLLDIARRNDQPLPADTVEGLASLYEFTDFEHFIRTWMLTTNCLRRAEDFRQIVVDYAQEAASHGVVYMEGIFSPAERVNSGIRWSEMFIGYTEGAVEARERFGIEIRFTPDLYRSMTDFELAEECARQCVRYAEYGIVGMGVGGKEQGYSLLPFRRAAQIVQEAGLGFVPHAGEGAGPESVIEALALDPHRIRHGIRAVEDPAVLKEIADRGIVLDVCPISNLRTKVVQNLEEHPLPQLVAAGIQCSISTDDPAMFDTDLARDYAAAASLGYTAEQAYAAGVAGALDFTPA